MTTELNVPKPPFLEGGGEWKLRGLTPMTIVMGKNGSGKSQLLRAIRNQDASQRHYIVPERPGNITYEGSYLVQQSDPATRQNVANANLHAEYRQHVVVRIQTYMAARGSIDRPDIPLPPKELANLVAPLLPDFALIFRNRNPPYELKRKDTQEVVGQVGQLSSGEAESFALGIDVLTMCAIWKLEERAAPLLLLDEPDTHLHPDLQERLADFLCTVSSHFGIQMIVATHSTTLVAGLAHYGAERASLIHMNRREQDLKAEPVSRHERELTAILGGHVLMGPLFGAPIVLVEGDDDYRAWSQVPRQNGPRLAVVPCNGGPEVKQYQRKLEEIFETLSDEAKGLRGYALLDADEALPAENTHPQKRIKFLQLACHETENLYVADEVLVALGHKGWEDARSKIRSAAPNYGNKRDALLAVADGDRMTSDLKGIIEPISAILDSKGLNWAFRLGKVMGQNTPTGQLAAFLGPGVMGALWNVEPPRPIVDAARAPTATPR